MFLKLFIELLLISVQEHSSLRFPEFRSAGAHLRSQEMKLPTNIGQKKLKNIETVIEKLKLGTDSHSEI